jgi:DNA-binding SARP family transcriptional activator
MPRQVRTVLEFLVSQGRRPTSKDAILDLLWPEANPTVACSRLRVVMHTLRRSIPCEGLGFKELVVMSGHNFMITPEATLQVDVEDFERHWLNGWRLARAGRTQEALSEYEQAEALYTGDYLEDEPYADWTLLRREALRDAYANILTMLATMSLEAGDYTGAIIWSQKLLARDNCREDAYRLLITSHQKLGQASRAAHWYDLCRWALRKELDMEPSEETQAVFSGQAHDNS